ncbi:hypothetical protein [Sulfuracidifex metallicus]|uniref:Uncharacterized protein n=1 Tax=Sulfuracidifex metallicus DSM 6482 = JCM 9184 TaxID=523847 RepID=A0A6A9QTI9_SULME|nr:hypothetical protein [Sulfuracidifex metallicus]MUN29083.1 hypothetical protein [Sulfuracidifex metallicus DSM 6482 = JCM 9184]WOE50405.1 hypothetical protein RQ359_001930 [Sulfuracidifex metallicus DSM 6482 = JCM 9184]
MEPHGKRLRFSPLSTWNPYVDDMDMDPLRIGTNMTRLNRNLERAPWSWKTSYEDSRITEYKVLKDGKRKVIAYYIPYSLNVKEWGIYLLKDEIYPDVNYLNSLIKRKGISAGISPVYLSLIFLHELTHHVIEDWRVSSGLFSYVQDDERLCEYTAFTLTQALFSRVHWSTSTTRSRGEKSQGVLGYPVPGISLQFPGLPKEIHFNYYDLISLLITIYYYWGRDIDKIYKVQVPSWVDEENFVKFLSQNLNVGLEEMWSGRRISSVYRRVNVV